ncbi:hypothetical protein BC739_000235 [Kutzneria viridogrisea]|uniref:Hemerythrin-like domain-containing protein n=1 Tax=Kutzneria viridogrisea TaxID=47990 RepID=A0ABR6B847_9PSEU|nr:hypothetical protein [Kutzneria viridogrisea]
MIAASSAEVCMDRITAGDLSLFLRAHDCFRRDLARLRQLLTRKREAPAARAQALVNCWSTTVRILEHHHEVEDHVMWPLVTARCAEAAEVLGELEAEHHRLDKLTAEVGTRLAELPGHQDAARKAVTDLDNLLGCHLAVEEQRVLPIILAEFSTADWAQVERSNGEDLMARGLLPEVLPWITDGAAPESAARFVALIAPGQAEVYQHEWLPAYTRRLAAAGLRTTA